MKYLPAQQILFGGLLLLVGLALPGRLSAQTLYFDVNGTTPGSGVTASTYNWNTSTSNWNTDSTGGAGGSLSSFINGRAVHFAAGTDATANYTVTTDTSVTSVDSLSYSGKTGTGTGSNLKIDGAGSPLEIVTGNVTVNRGVSAPNNNYVNLQVRLSGSNGLTVDGGGQLWLNYTGASTYSGTTTVKGSNTNLYFQSSNMLPTASVLDLQTGAFIFLPNTQTLAGLTGSGGITSNHATLAGLVLNSASGTHDFSGAMTANVGGRVTNITKQGAFTQILSGSNLTGSIIVSGGVLALNNSAADNTTLSSGTILISGGSLRLDTENQINNTADMTLSGGTFDLNGVSAETLGTLEMTLDSTIDFGSGTSALAFAASNAETWGVAQTLTIDNFNPGTDTLKFGTDSSGLTVSQLAQIQFTGYALGGEIDSLGFVTPVPEPGTLAFLLGAGLFFAQLRLRRSAS